MSEGNDLRNRKCTKPIIEISKSASVMMSPSTGTGRYCRSSKYHDKAVDVLHSTGNGFLVTASQGSKFVKIWRMERKDRGAYTYDLRNVC